MSRENSLLKVLLIDDDINLCKVLAHQLKKQGYAVTSANDGQSGLRLFRDGSFDLVITDIQMPDITGIEVLQNIRLSDSNVVVIIITAHGSVQNAIEACQLGADDYIAKPFGQEQLLFIIEKALRFRNLQEENADLKMEVAGKYKVTNMISSSPAMQQVLKMSMRVARSNATVLISGESGTGKELIARAIHYNSDRKDKPLVTVNCPSIPENLMESELFGHVKGAFTGAIRDRIGKFEQADGGTLFLDEIGDLKADLQSKLLRVLQEHEFERIGDTRTIKTNVRIIAATNRDLNRMVSEKKFREDLYYRLSVVPIIIPPLRAHKEDIPLLIKHFADRYGGGAKYRFSSDVIEAITAYDWPGNIRELENLIERLITLAGSTGITIADLPENILGKVQPSAAASIPLPEEGIGLDEVERRVISEMLRRTGGNQSETARLLKIPRHVLLYRIKKLGLQGS